MTTSGSDDFNQTRNEIIGDAMLFAGGIDADDTIDETQIRIGSRQLNKIIKRLSGKYPIWGHEDHTIPLYDQKQFYTLGPDGNKNIDRPLKITQGRRIIANSTIENPIDLVSRQEYMELPNKDSESPVNLYYYDAQLVQGKLHVWGVGTTDSVSLTDGSTDQWTDSPTTPNEYYYTGSGITEEPTYVFINGVECTEGTIGSLGEYEYVWGDQDALGSDTLYVYQTSDPDSQVSGWIKVLTTQPDKIIITVVRPLENFDDADNTPDYPQEGLDALTMALAVPLCLLYDTSKYQALKLEADNLLAEFLTTDTEDAPFEVVPRKRY
jgi:hypothetical protein